MKTVTIGLALVACLAACGALYANENKAPAKDAKSVSESGSAPALDPSDMPALKDRVEYAGDAEVSTGPVEYPYIGLVPGYRGTSIPAPGDQLLYVKKGDRVDVLVTFDTVTAKEVKEKVTATILQNVIVINVKRPDNVKDMGAIELLCNPNEAQYLALSEAQGKTSIAVRAPGDVEMHPMEMASFRKLIK
ncbi:MAG: RcpC/CpaB family pilus assembly protein [Elusimicrobia bacterium]|nr:RcpC/CpaB family pilus assembly protein [Elusimicrobiota bacterium]